MFSFDPALGQITQERVIEQINLLIKNLGWGHHLH